MHEEYEYPDEEDLKYFWEVDYWVDKKGVNHRIEDMDTSYINNVVKMILSKGFYIQYTNSVLEHEIQRVLEERQPRNYPEFD